MKKNIQIIGMLALMAFIFVPMFAHAQLTGGNIGEVTVGITNFIGTTLMTLVFAIALLMFVWGLFSSFILGGANEEKRKEGKQLMLWGIIAFAVMVSIWGLVSIITTSFDLNGNKSVTIPTIPSTSGSAGSPFTTGGSSAGTPSTPDPVPTDGFFGI
ncbi:hypothetical protein COB87_002055 [Candidatus Wolfebacteria bacterium]|nr:hypothetical protein [Candidatus Wolfebacteria bacterium]